MNGNRKVFGFVLLIASAWLAGCGMQFTRYDAHPGSRYNTFSYLVDNETTAPLEMVSVSVDPSTVPAWLRLGQTHVDLGTVPSGEGARARFRYDVAGGAEEDDVANLRVVARAGDRVVQEDRITITLVRKLPPGYYTR